MKNDNFFFFLMNVSGRWTLGISLHLHMRLNISINQKISWNISSIVRL